MIHHEQKVGEVKVEYLVAAVYKDGPGGASSHATLEQAEAECERMRGDGYGKPHCPLVIYKRTVERIK